MKAIVLLSGGIDSAVALWWAQAQGWNVDALTFNYHRRPPGEGSAMEALVAAAGGPRLTAVDLPFLREVADLGGQVHNPALATSPEGYIPARNLIFYSLALNRAEVLGAERIVGGHNGGDSQNFPDAAPGFFDGLNGLTPMGLLTGRTRPVRILLPLVGLSKVQVLHRGVELGVPLGDTWSCYWDGPKHCGKCESCRERRTAFSAAGLVDPTEYAGAPHLTSPASRGARAAAGRRP